MKVEQISVFLENKSGRIAKVTRLLADAKINIRALSIADTSDFGILRLIVDSVPEAVSTLKDGGLTVSTTDVIAVEIPDIPGGLASVIDALDRGGINFEYMYAFVGKSSDKAVVVFKVEELEQAASILKSTGIRLLCPSDISKF